MSSLCVCEVLCCINWGQQLHMEIVNKGMEEDIFVANGLVDMDAKSMQLSLRRIGRVQ